jgi:hypothetical protein
MLFTPASMLLLTPLLQKLSFDPDKQLLPVTNVGTGAQMIAIKRAHAAGISRLREGKSGQAEFCCRRNAEHQSPGTSPSVCTRRRQPGDGARQKARRRPSPI